MFEDKTLQAFIVLISKLITYRVLKTGTSFSLLWMIEPLDSDNHIARVRLPHRNNSANVGTIGSSRGQKHCTITNLDRLSAPLYCLEELFLDATFNAALPIALSCPCPQLTRWQKGRNLALVLLRTCSVLLFMGVLKLLHSLKLYINIIYEFPYRQQRINLQLGNSCLKIIIGHIEGVHRFRVFSLFAFGCR